MKTNGPLISVVIPAYNQASYLSDAIGSVLCQSYRDFEVIVVDDGSTDETSEVAKRFGEQINYVWQENQGLAGARNRGIAEARGAYVALLDSDDQWQPDFLQKMMALANRYPHAALYYSAAHCMDAEGNPLPQKLGMGLIAPNDAKSMYWTLLRANFLIPSTILMARRTIIEAGLFDPSFQCLEDWELWLRLLSMGHTFAGTTEGLIRYRLHEKSLSTKLEKMQSTTIVLAQKHFGADDKLWMNWSKEKRRFYGGVYRYHALTSLQGQAQETLINQNDWHQCAHYLRQAFQIDPSYAVDLDLFYELALGNQPLGYRDSMNAEFLTLEQNANRIEAILKELFEPPLPSALQTLHRQSYGTAYYALGLVSSRIKQRAFSQKYLKKALHFRPELLGETHFIKMLIKSFIDD